MVRALYAKYPIEGDRPGKAVWNESREVLSRYFDPKLTELFLADQACQERNQGPCAVTVDLLCGCQAGDPSGLRICRSARGPEWVDVRFMIFRGKTFKEEETLSFLTSRTAAGWRISDIHYDDGSSLVRSFDHPTLVTEMLQELPT